MSKLLMLLLFVDLTSCRSLPKEDSAEVKFYGADARRATMEFQTTLYYDLPVGYTGDVTQLYKSSLKDDIDEAINLQLAHIYSVFVNHTKPFDFVSTPGIPREKPDIKVLSTTRVAGHAAAYVTYSYSDFVVFKKSLFHGSDIAKLSFYLPRNPRTIYAAGLVKMAEAKKLFEGDPDSLESFKSLQAQGSKEVNLCTDLHYNYEGDYWYFWNPYNKGCSQSTRDGLQLVEAKLKPINSTVKTYPDYKKLYADNGNGDELRITFLVGVDENFRNGDLGVASFRKSFEILTKGKGVLSRPDAATYLLPGEITELKAVADADDIRFTVLRDEYRQKSLRFVGNGYKVLLNMYLIEAHSADFPAAAVKGLRESDVFIYDGHSGLGSHLSVGRLFAKRKYDLPKNKYQIFFFNGCSTFSYYNFDYFQLKATPSDPEGIVNLDILTTSLPALFDRGSGNDTLFIRHLAAGKKPSWQQIVNSLYKAASDGGAMITVSGDENNPTSL